MESCSIRQTTEAAEDCYKYQLWTNEINNILRAPPWEKVLSALCDSLGTKVLPTHKMKSVE